MKDYQNPEVLRKLYWKEGFSITQIANQFKTHNSVVRLWMVKNNIPRRPPKRIVPEKYKISNDLLKELYIRKGLSVEKIARRFNATYETIRQKLIKYKIPLRIKGSYEKYIINKNLLKDLYKNRKLSIRKIAEKLKIKDNKIIHSRLVKYNIPRRTISEALRRYPRIPFNGNLEEKAYMIGLRQGDFSAYDGYGVRIMSTSTKPNQIKMFRDTFNKYGHTHVYKNKTSSGWCMYCYLDDSFNFLIEKFAKLPDWIINNDSLFYSFLAAYADCEGCWNIIKDGKNAIRFTFMLSNNDKTILEQIGNKLTRDGYTPYLRLRGKKGDRTNLGVHTQDHYIIVINKKKDITSLAKKLLNYSRHEDKRYKMKLMLRFQNKMWSDFIEEV